MKKVVLLFLLVLLSGCITVDTFRLEESLVLMGTTATITILGGEENPIDAAFDEIKRIEELMSGYDDESQISILNNGGVSADPEVVYLVEKSKYYSELSNGAFDITVQPILDLYSKSFGELKRAPTDEEINEVLELIGYDKVAVDHEVKLEEGMKVTLGGIAKGYAIDRAIMVLEENGVKNALVNIGGDVKGIGTHGWDLALENPRDKGDYITIIDISDKAVATSGDYERYFDADKKFHHIVDPRTGYSATSLISVTIVADDALEADAIATAVFVLGVDDGLKLIESLDGVEGLLITSKREIVRSGGFEW